MSVAVGTQQRRYLDDALDQGAERKGGAVSTWLDGTCGGWDFCLEGTQPEAQQVDFHPVREEGRGEPALRLLARPPPWSSKAQWPSWTCPARPRNEL